MRGTCGDDGFMNHLQTPHGFTATGCNPGGKLVNHKTSELLRVSALAKAVDTNIIDAVCLVETHLTNNNSFGKSCRPEHR